MKYLKSISQLFQRNIRILLLLVGILVITLFVQFFMMKEGFYSAMASSMDKALDSIDEESKQKIIQEVKIGIDNVSKMTHDKIDFYLPCLLKTSSCPNGLSFTPFGGVQKNEVVPKSTGEYATVPPATIDSPIDTPTSVVKSATGEFVPSSA